MRLRNLVDPDVNTILSFDFWDTIVINTESPRERWHKTMRELIDEFKLEKDCETYEFYYNKIATSLRKLNKEYGYDFEYKSKAAWSFLSSLIFIDTRDRLAFQDRAYEIYLRNAVLGSKLNPYFEMFYQRARNQNRIIITSDYEFDKHFIRHLLQQKGLVFPLENIYVSCDLIANKLSGTLFLQLLEKFRNRRIVHIGDDLKSDFLMARRAGIDTIFHARVDNAIIRKYSFLKTKYIAKFKKIPWRIPTYRNDISLLNSSMLQFKSYVESNLRPGDKVFFLGSEGAFFSQFFDDAFHFRNFSTCVNFGRKEILQELFPVDPDFVASILLLEELTINEFLRYLKSFITISNDELIEALNEGFEKYRSCDKPLKSPCLFYLFQQNPNLFARIVTVDIGYKGTFSMALSRIQDTNVTALQLLGFEQIQRRDNLEIQSLLNVTFSVFGRSFSTKYLESILATGPRSEFSLHGSVLEIQNALLKSKSKRTHRLQKLIHFSRLPSRTVQRAIDRTRLDDLRIEKNNGSKLS